MRAIWYDLSLNLFNKPNWLHDLNYPYYQAIRQIKDSESVMVLPADKNLGPVILDKEWVINETLGMLMTDSYAVVDESEWLLKRDYIIKQRDKVCDVYKHLLSETELKYLSHFDDLSESLLPARFYIIPKIHKNPMMGRPITASCSYITRPISVLVDEYLKSVLSLPTVLRDSSELIVDLDGKELPPHCIMFTADVVSRYPSINIKRAIPAIDTLLREHKAQETLLLTTLLRLVLENNFVKCDFSTQIFLQLLGLAMGTPLAVTVANALMCFIERHLMQSYREKGYLLYFKRFIDDIIGIWNGNFESLNVFFLNLIILRTELISHMSLVSTGCHIWIFGFLSVRNHPPPIVLNSPLTRNHLTSICISRLSLFIPTATRKLLLKVSSFVIAGVVQPLNLSML